MDVYCKRCGEPIDIGEFPYIADDEGVPVAELRRAFTEKGCIALGYPCNTLTLPNGTTVWVDEVYQLAGDDFDGAAADLDDLRSMGVL
jgi:hypothetical protein